MPKVSVIIPVYNIEKYLRECLDSIVNQTLIDLEIICVDDASPDNSFGILKEYEKKDNRVIVLRHHKNLGLSSARNTGLLRANGKYVYFMDGDDILDLETFEICYEQCSKYNLDVLTFDAETFLDQKYMKNNFVDITNYNYDRKNILSGSSFLHGKEFFYNAFIQNAYKSSVCLNIIRCETLKEEKIAFSPGILHEDELFTIQLYFSSKRIMYYPRKFFKRRLRNDSIMNNEFNSKNIKDITFICDELFKLYLIEDNKNIKDALLEKIYSLLIWMERMMDEIKDVHEKQKIKIIVKKSNTWIKYKHNKMKNYYKKIIIKIIRSANLFNAIKINKNQIFGL